MPAPYNYGIQMPDFQGQFLQGLKFLDAIEQQKAAREQAQRRQDIMRNLSALGSSATADDYIKASMQLPEDRELFKQTWDMHEEGKKNALFNGGSEAYLLASAGKGEEAAAKLNEYATAFENSGDKQAADQFRTAAKIAETDPQALKSTIGMMLSFADGDRFKNIAQTSDSTTFQKDFKFIKDTFGDDAAAEYAQYGRDGIVSLPLPGGRTYVGPASSAPGASRWQAKGGADQAAPAGVPEILQRASQSKSITQAEAETIKSSLGPNGQKQFEAWMADNGIKQVVRSGVAQDGRRVVEYSDGTISYAD